MKRVIVSIFLLIIVLVMIIPNSLSLSITKTGTTVKNEEANRKEHIKIDSNLPEETIMDNGDLNIEKVEDIEGVEIQEENNYKGLADEKNMNEDKKNHVLYETDEYIVYDDYSVEGRDKADEYSSFGTGEMIMLAHLNSRSVEVGQYVKQGTKIGIMGNTGQSEGAHVHIERWNYVTTDLPSCDSRIDPSEYLNVFNSSYRVTQSYNEYYARYACNGRHKGTDVVPNSSDWTVNSPVAGIVRRSSYDDTFGNQIVIEISNETEGKDGHLDSFNVTKKDISINGWHTDKKLNNSETSFIYIIDDKTGEEYYRSRITRSDRADVAKLYPNIAGALRSGFNMNIPITDAMRGKNIRVISRYATDLSGNSSKSDLNFSLARVVPTTIKDGHLDNFTANGQKITVGGWHTDEIISGKEISVISVVDAITGTQYSQTKVNRTERLDVASLHKNIPEALQSGFEATIPVTENMSGRTVKIMSSYINSSGYSISQIKFNEVTRKIPTIKKDGYLESINVNNNINNIEVKGWHTASNLMSNETSYLIVINSVSGEEYVRTKINRTERTDVAALYKDLPWAKSSGFSTKIPITDNMRGKNIKVISRYAKDTGGDESISDIVYGTTKLIPSLVKDGYLESINVNNTTNNIQLSGWHTTNNLMGSEVSYLFVINSATGEEYARQKISRIDRVDVASLYKNIPWAKASGFNTTIPITDNMRGKTIKIISRYAKDTRGDQSNSDIVYSTTIGIPGLIKDGYLETFNINKSTNQIEVTGWHTANNLFGTETSYLFVIDATTGAEYSRIKINRIARVDVANLYKGIPWAQTSGFDLKIPITDTMKGKNIKIISRYSKNVNGDQSISDIVYPAKKLI